MISKILNLFPVLLGLVLAQCVKPDGVRYFSDCSSIGNSVTISDTLPDISEAYGILRLFEPLDSETIGTIESLYNRFPDRMPRCAGAQCETVQQVVSVLLRMDWHNSHLPRDTAMHDYDPLDFDIKFSSLISPYFRACCVQFEELLKRGNFQQAVHVLAPLLKLTSRISELKVGYITLHSCATTHLCLALSVDLHLPLFNNNLEMLTEVRTVLSDNRLDIRGVEGALMRDYKARERILETFKEKAGLDATRNASRKGGCNPARLYWEMVSYSYSRLLHSIQLPLIGANLDLELCELETYKRRRDEILTHCKGAGIVLLTEFDAGYLIAELEKLKRYSLEYYVGVRYLAFFENRFAIHEFITKERRSPSSLQEVERKLGTYLPNDPLIETQFVYDAFSRSLTMLPYADSLGMYSDTFQLEK